ncbi:hypothetical protein [Flavobacterium sp. N1736]|uniref:hypothetical protein n=1 Tax=Flavobacterium sp. N1736 TaxID=2986823 RepID=UPI002225AC2E|nr:hypothetical protein [Flavobacterium sp. N1736]
MPNNTREHYKEAIRIKFEKEKNGVNSNYFNPTSQANLRDLCWKIFKSNPSTDDLNVYRDFVGSEFNPSNEDTSIGYTDKFRKVGSFLKRKKEPLKFDTVNFAAILVDFELRPYQKFYALVDSQKPEEAINNFLDLEKVNEDEDIEVETPVEKENLPSDNEGNKSTEQEKPSRKTKFFEKLLRLFKKSKQTIIIVAIVFGVIGIGTAIYLAFFNKGCMQWSEDHYEVVDCKEGIEGNPNEIIVYDSHLLDFKKIPVCDTTTWYANGQSIIWYGKTNNQVDFFNSCGNGRHPETKKTLRPLTDYIKGKYQSKNCTSK